MWIVRETEPCLDGIAFEDIPIGEVVEMIGDKDHALFRVVKPDKPSPAILIYCATGYEPTTMYRNARFKLLEATLTVKEK